MPEWASRLRLKITGVKVVRAHQIRRADVEAMGLNWDEWCWDWHQIYSPEDWDKWCAIYTVERVSDD